MCLAQTRRQTNVSSILICEEEENMKTYSWINYIFFYMAFTFISVFYIYNVPSLLNLIFIVERENEALGS